VRTGGKLLLESRRDGLWRRANVDAVVRRGLRVAEEAIGHVQFELPRVEQLLLAVPAHILTRPAGRGEARPAIGMVRAWCGAWDHPTPRRVIQPPLGSAQAHAPVNERRDVVYADHLAGRTNELGHRGGEVAAAAAHVECTAAWAKLVAQFLEGTRMHVRRRDRDPPSDRLRTIAEATGSLAAVVLPIHAFHALAYTCLHGSPSRGRYESLRSIGGRVESASSASARACVSTPLAQSVSRSADHAAGHERIAVAWRTSGWRGHSLRCEGG